MAVTAPPLQATTKPGPLNSPANMTEDLKNIVIGAVTLAVLLLGGLFSFTNSAVDKSGGVFVTAQFNRIDGLDAGTEIRMGGIKIGEVTALDLKEDYFAEATLRIEANIPIPTDTSVAIHTSGIFGGKYVTLEPGAEEGYMKTGDAFEVTQGSVDVQDLLDLIIDQAKSNQAKIREQLEELKKLQAGSKG